MQCQEFEHVLEQRMGEGLPADAAAHLNDCARCRAVVADFEAIQAAAQYLVVEAEPPAHIWLALRAQLESEGLIRTPPPAVARAAGGWLGSRWGALLQPALASAYLVLLLGAVVLVSLVGQLRQSQPRTPVVALQPASTSLDTQLASEGSRTVQAMNQHDPAVTASLRENLYIVDNFIALCEKSVREEPQNEAAREYLYGAYQQKAELLAMVMDRDASGDQ